MTENEAKEIVKKLRNKAELFKNSGFAVDGIVKSFEDSANAIETLSEEIQQYRAIGLTPELIEAMRGHNVALINDLGEYQAIGTIEEFKALKEKEERFDRNIRMFNEIGLEIRAKAIDEFAHQLKETLNQEFPSNYESTRPYFSLENARLSVDDIAEQMKAGEIDG